MLNQEQICLIVNETANGVHKSVFGPLMEETTDPETLKKIKNVNPIAMQVFLASLANNIKGGDSNEKT